MTCGFFVLSDALVNAAAVDRLRGRLVAAYLLAESGGAILGPLLLSGVGFEGIRPFGVASAIMLAGIAPWFLVDSLRSPSLGGEEAEPMLAVLRSAPLILLVAGAEAFFEDVPATLLPVFALARGLDESTAVLMLCALALGALLFQLPAGWAADRMERRAFLLFMAVSAAPLSLALLPATGTWAMWLLLPLLGGVLRAFALMALVLVGERSTLVTPAGLNAAATLARSVSSFVGPPATGWFMDRAGPGALLVAMASVAVLVFVGCVADRVWRRAPRVVPGAVE